MMENNIISNQKSLLEALTLAEELLRNIELSELPLENIALKTIRLARLLNDFEMLKIMQYETGGYPKTIEGLPNEIYNLAVTAGREFEKKSDKSESVKRFVYRQSIREIEEGIKLNEISLKVAKDPNVSISSANPNQYINANTTNKGERTTIRMSIMTDLERLASRRLFIYNYALMKYAELKFSGISDDFFTRLRVSVDKNIGDLLPESVTRFNAIYDNLLSENTEDWSNAVHSCRRILEDLADLVFPAQSKEQTRNGKKIKLGKDNYINRIICFVEDNSGSERFEHLIGAHISFLGERLDSIFQATQKGSHTTIMSREEADRYVIYTYMIIGDILSLYQPPY